MLFQYCRFVDAKSAIPSERYVWPGDLLGDAGLAGGRIRGTLDIRTGVFGAWRCAGRFRFAPTGGVFIGTVRFAPTRLRTLRSRRSCRLRFDVSLAHGRTRRDAVGGSAVRLRPATAGGAVGLGAGTVGAGAASAPLLGTCSVIGAGGGVTA